MSALERVLDDLGIGYQADRYGNQQIRCPFPEHEDSSPSCSLRLDSGLLNCMACGKAGDVISLVMALQGTGFKAAKSYVDSLGGVTRTETTKGEPREPGSYKPRYRRARPEAARRRWGV